MHTIIAMAGPNDDASDVNEEYMTLVAAAARQCGVTHPDEDEEFEGYSDQGFKRQYRKAVSAATRLSLAAKQRRSVTMLAFPDGAKARLRKHLSDLEAAIDAADLPEKRKKTLRSKLSEFSVELDKERSNIGKMCAVLALVAAALGGAESDIVKLPKTVAAIIKIVGDIKGDELESAPGQVALPASDKRKALEAPASASDSPSDLDDEIPF
jgi:hypothetical protein